MQALWLKLLQRPLWLQLCAALLATAFMGLVLAIWGQPLHQWDERLASQTWALSDANATERRVVIIDIDEKSVQALGPWPWPRERIATLLTQLNHYGVKLNIADILFEGTQTQDTALATALAAAPSVIGQLLTLPNTPPDHTPPMRSGQPAGALNFAACPAQSSAATGYLAPASTLAAAAHGVGHITPVLDPDGAVRRVPALVCHNGKTYPALAVAALSAATGAAPRLLPAGQAGTPMLDMGGITLPIDAQGHIRVSYQMPRSGFVAVSAVDVLQGRVPANLLFGSWALIGATALGAGDAIPTPQGGAVGGLEVHAQILSAALDARTPYAPAWTSSWPWLTGAIAALLLILATNLATRKTMFLMPLSALTLVTLLFILHAWLLLHQHLWLNWGQPALYIVLLATLLGGAEQLRLHFERERLFLNLSSYLPANAARQVAFAAPSAQVQAQNRNATVMFIDVRNFSAYCEHRSPEDTATVLHLFYTTAERIVTQHGGVVEQMVGDSVMAVWNGSNPCADHAQSAVAAASTIWQQCLAQLPKVASRSTPPLDIGIGIETGPVLVGSFGPARRRVHTVMGEAVGVAARLEKLTAELGYPILLGPRASCNCAQPGLQKLGDFLLAGFSQPRTLFALPVKLDHSHMHLVYSLDQFTSAIG